MQVLQSLLSLLSLVDVQDLVRRTVADACNWPEADSQSWHMLFDLKSAVGRFAGSSNISQCHCPANSGRLTVRLRSHLEPVRNSNKINEPIEGL